MTNEQMLKSIKTQLGWPSIDLDVNDAQLSGCIELAILMAKDHLQARRYKSFTVLRKPETIALPQYCYCVDLSDLDFDVVTQVYRGDMLSPYLYDQFYMVNYATRGVPSALAIAINMRSNTEALINRQWKVIGKTLFLDKFYTGVTIEFIPTVIGIEDIEDNFWLSWIMRYAIACAKEMIGRVRGKLVVDSNPFKTDAESLISESSTEKANLLEEIQYKGLLDISR